MYQSKRDGRNRVTMAKPVSETSWQEIAVNTFTDILSKHNMPISKDLTDDLQQKLKEQDAGKEALYSIADILAKTYNPAHNEGISKTKNIMAVALAKRFDLPKEDIDNLRVAMLLYDIGNLMIAPEILQKKSPLTADEKKSIQEHPIIAARNILKPISYIQDVIPIIEHHHENWDGTGYPRHASKENIPLTSQIVLIVDSYFALIEKRPYRDKLSSTDALRIIKKDSGKKWNAALVQEFVTLIEQENKSLVG
jgi:HD-GYP domain-containing protein (c-di-GMP phosphodiesterase class II)